MRRLEQHQKMEKLVPAYMDEEFPVLAAWYYKKGSLSLEQAADIAGLSRQGFKAFLRTNKLDPSWIEVGQFFTEKLNKREFNGRKTFRAYIIHETDYHYDYIRRILRTYHAFRGTPLEALQCRRAVYLFQHLAEDKIIELKTTGELTVDTKKITVQDISLLSQRDFYRLVSKVRTRDEVPCPHNSQHHSIATVQVSSSEATHANV